MTLRRRDLQSDSDLDSIRNSCDVLFPAAFLLNLTQLLLNFEFLFLICLQRDMFAVGGHESTLLCCIGVSDRRSVIVTSFFLSK